MNKKFLISTVVVFIVWMAGSFVIHGVLLSDAYAALGALYRPEAQQQETFPFMLAAHVIMSAAFVWVYQRGAEAKPWLAQGVRYGVAVWLLAGAPTYLIYYAVQPLPMDLVVSQIIYVGIQTIVLGVVVAFLNKPATAGD